MCKDYGVKGGYEANIRAYTKKRQLMVKRIGYRRDSSDFTVTATLIGYSELE